jgi:hypothetical protein
MITNENNNASHLRLKHKTCLGDFFSKKLRKIFQIFVKRPASGRSQDADTSKTHGVTCRTTAFCARAIPRRAASGSARL